MASDSDPTYALYRETNSGKEFIGEVGHTANDHVKVRDKSGDEIYHDGDKWVFPALSTEQTFSDDINPTYRVWQDGSEVVASKRGNELSRSTDATTVFNAIHSDAPTSTAERERQVLIQQGIYEVDPLSFSKSLYLIGETFNTVLKLKDGSNDDLITWERTDNKTVGFIGLQRMRLDANKSNNTAGRCLVIGDNISDGTFKETFFKNGADGNIYIHETGNGTRPPWNHYFINIWSEWANNRSIIVEANNTHSDELYGIGFHDSVIGGNDNGIQFLNLRERSKNGNRTVSNCQLYGQSTHDIEIRNSVGVNISGNNCHGAGGTGILVNQTATPNPDNITLTGNHIIDANTGVSFDSSTDDISLTGGSIKDCTTTIDGQANPTNLTISGVGGITLRDNGVKTLSSGSTSVTGVSHDVDTSPGVADVEVWFAGDPGSAKAVWASNITDTTFDINVDVDPAQDVSIGWRVDASADYSG